MRYEQPKLVVADERRGWAVAWWYEEDGDIGGVLGDCQASGFDERLKAARTPADFEGLEHEAATLAAAGVVAKLHPDLVDCRSGEGYYFERESDAKAALKAANAALKTLRTAAKSGSASEPLWAMQARDAGWTPPAGWKP